MSIPKNYPQYGWQQRLFDAAEVVRDHETEHLDKLGEIAVTADRAWFNVTIGSGQYRVTVTELKTQDRD